MVTTPLYVEDSYIKEFTAYVVRSGPKYAVLDRTAFYPEGGGQPSDTGFLRWNNNEVKVFKVLKRSRDIYHYLREDIPVGIEVKGILDWDNRFLNMRRHSAEHLLTGLLEAEGGDRKVYSDLEKLEYRNSCLEEGTLNQIMEKFNEIVDRDIDVKIFYQNRDSVDVESDPRKSSFLEKIPSNIHRIRMVQIGDYALTFCMGTHVKSTSDIGHLVRLELDKAKKGRRVVYFFLESLIFQ